MPEKSLKQYLSQFGTVSRLRIARNKKTGAMKHYGFVEFADKDVALIVAETMNNYLLEGRLLQCKIVPKEKQHPTLWLGANRSFRKVPGSRLFRLKHDDTNKSEEQKLKSNSSLLSRQEKRRKRIKDLGIDYDFQGYS